MAQSSHLHKRPLVLTNLRDHCVERKCAVVLCQQATTSYLYAVLATRSPQLLS